MTDVNSSGAELPAAMNVAPATSSLRWRRCVQNKNKTGELGFYLGIHMTVTPHVPSSGTSEGPRGRVQCLVWSSIQRLALSAICSPPSPAESAGYKTSLAKRLYRRFGVHNPNAPRGCCANGQESGVGARSSVGSGGWSYPF